MRLQTLFDVGLGYIVQLGQPADAFWGEAQRVKLRNRIVAVLLEDAVFNR
jgi:excinuclease UvrABC ATPase subunit